MAHRTLNRETRLALSLLVLSLVPLACNKGRYDDQGGAGTAATPPAGTPSATAAASPTGADTSKPAGTADVAMGDRIFHGKTAGGTCFSCHGQNAKGTTLAPNLTDQEWLNSDGTQEGIARTIKEGVTKPKKFQAPMPPMGGSRLSEDQVHAVAAYVYSLSH